MSTTYLAGYKTSFRDTGKAHACDTSTLEVSQSRDKTYTSRCGQRWLYTTGQTFDRVIKFEQCQRCFGILEAEATTEETAGLKAAIATLEEFEAQLPTSHPDHRGVVRAIEVLRIYGPRQA